MAVLAKRRRGIAKKTRPSLSTSIVTMLSDALDAQRVFTLDRRGFRAYRGARGLALEMVALALK